MSSHLIHHEPAVSAPACDYPAWRPPRGVRLVVCPEHPCPYLPERMAQSRAFWAEEMDAVAYHRFMDAGFRRSGRVVYQPICRGCRACLPIRIPVDRFMPSKSQRRCWRRNQDLKVTVHSPSPTAEKHELYQRYLAEWHQGPMKPGAPSMDGHWEEFRSFLYDSPVDTVEFCYRGAGGPLLAVGICDMSAQSLSSVYFYFDPAHARRSLGTFGVLYEIDMARALQIPHYYLGYWVRGCGAMEYKSSFRPCEILWPDGIWRTRPEARSGQEG